MRTLPLFAVAIALAASACSSTPDEKVIVVPGWGSSSPGDSGLTSSSGASGSGSGGSSGATSSGSGSGGSSSGATGDGGAAAATGVPCDVATMLAANCTGCHSDPPMPSALAGLVTYADLMATSHEDPTKNEAQLSLSRMQNASSPMPPGGAPAAADVTTLQNWINAGYPKGSCGTTADGGTSGDGGSGPPPPRASSPTLRRTRRARGTTRTTRDATAWAATPEAAATRRRSRFGGTVYDASGKGVSGAEVRIVDANGTATSVYTGPSGTFYKGGSFAGPAHIGVRNATATQNMVTALQSTSQPPASTGGACSACHCTGAGCTMAAIHLP